MRSFDRRAVSREGTKVTEKLLLIIPEGSTLENIKAKLGPECELLIAANWEDALTILHEKRRELTAILIDLAYARERGNGCIQELTGGDPFSLMPIIGVTGTRPTPVDADSLDKGIYDLLASDTPGKLMISRIRSAARATDSISFHDIETLLKALPSNIFLKDTEGRYVFCTHYWHHLYHADDPNWTIRGKTDLEIRKDRDNALKAMEADRRIVATGVGTEYTIQEHCDGILEYLELIKRPVFDDNGKVTGIVALINDVTEKELLKLELEKRAQVDQLTELLNKSTTQELVEMRISAGNRSDKHGALIMIDVDNFKIVNDQYGHAMGDRVLSEIGRIIRNSFRGADVAGRVGGDEFMVYAMDIDSPEAAVHLAERVAAQIGEIPGLPDVTLSVGIALFPLHGKTFEELYRAADTALYQVKKGGKSACRLYSA